MGEELQIVNEIFKRAREQYEIQLGFRPGWCLLPGINAAVDILSAPASADLLEWLKAYCDKEQHGYK